MKTLFIFIFFAYSLFALPIQLIKKENSDSNTTLLVIGGIHGNEPGGYFAAAILAMHYKILSKNLWIVPNLNQPSIQANKRGIYGDMNRKFAHMKANDPDKKRVQAIKEIILDPKVSLVLNLHDGHGFYRKEYQGSIFNPNAWGQTCVIDQCKLSKQQKFGDLDEIAKKVKESINKKLLKKHHSFNVKNTNTKFDDEAMQQSLTYFAVTHNKPAFAIETSKNLTTLSQKVFYQLVAIEEFMNVMGIKYKRDFDLTLPTLQKIIKNYGYLYINDNIIIKLSNIKKTLRFIPLKSKHNKFLFSHLLGSFQKDREGNFRIYIGNKQVTLLKPEYFEIAKNCPGTFLLKSNNIEKKYKITSEIEVIDDFVIEPMKNIRVNVIGYTSSQRNESGITISYNKLNKRYSIDKESKIFRVEFYKKNKFCAMSLVHFK